MIIVETERLVLRCFHFLDAEAMYRVFGDAEVMRFGRAFRRACGYVIGRLTGLCDLAG